MKKTYVCFFFNCVHIDFETIFNNDMSHLAYACKTKGKNGISRLISEMA